MQNMDFLIPDDPVDRRKLGFLDVLKRTAL